MTANASPAVLAPVDVGAGLDPATRLRLMLMQHKELMAIRDTVAYLAAYTKWDALAGRFVTEAGPVVLRQLEQRAEWAGEIGALQEQLAAAEHAARRDKADAERYRHLRDKAPRTSERGKTGVFICTGSVYGGFAQPYRQDMDAVVDCAMAGGDTYELTKQLAEKRRDANELP